MKTFLIYGNKDVGKSTACCKLIKALHAIGASILFFQTFDWGDFKAVLRFEGRLVAIYSPGDERAHLREAINFGFEHGCDVLVAAVRCGIAYNAPLQEMPEGNPYEWLSLPESVNASEREFLENGVAIELIGKIHKM